MASVSAQIAHVYRRLGIGAHPDLVADTGSVDEAIGRCLDLDGPEKAPQRIPVPRGWDEVYEVAADYEPIVWWIEAMAAPGRLVEERLTWFWHDHFAVSWQKVDHPYLMWEHLRTLRRHATGNFAELLEAVATDPAMLFYLDGADNTVDAPNENFARELMELHTLGVGHYRQRDVVEGARACTGWRINETRWDDEGNELVGSFERSDVAPWGAFFDPDAHDPDTKTFLGRTGRLGMGDVLAVLLDHPRTAEFVAGKLYRHLVGHDPDPRTLDRLAAGFRRDYEILPLVEAIVADPAFVADPAIRAKVRTPVEKVVTVFQSFPRVADLTAEDFGWILYDVFDRLGYLPLRPPNPAGYPEEGRLLGPGQLAAAFGILDLVEPPADDLTADDVLDRLGLVDAGERTRRVLAAAPNPALALALALGSPEFLLT